MTIFHISKSTLNGVVSVSGAKNSVLKLLTASLLSPKRVLIRNYPAELLDAQIHVGMLEALGKRCVITKDEVSIEESSTVVSTLDWNDRSIRNTLLILGALTARTGYGKVPLPGGCQLGDRSFDLHELVLRKLGARVWSEGKMLCAEATNGLIGTDIILPIRSTGATENAILSATYASGKTTLWNPHIRPEIIDLVDFLNKMGAKIRVFGQERIEIVGFDEIKEIEHTVIPDNMEAITWLVASVMTNGDVEIKNFPYNDLEIPLIHLRESGARFYTCEDSLIVRGGTTYPLEISTGPYPAINSDVQPIFAAYAACAFGESRIVDLRFPGRYAYAKEMENLGLEHATEGNLLKIFGRGASSLTGGTVTALDLRAGAALSLCGLVADGRTVIKDAWQIERGYNDFANKLARLGGRIEVHGR